ncbi:MAG: mechanosensitive ion channel family protein [Chitinophagaceae bacterium]
MQKFMDIVILGNPLRGYLILMLGLLFVFILRGWVSRSIAGLFHRMIRTWSAGVDKKEFFTLFVRPLKLFLMLMAVLFLIDALKFPAVLNIRIYHANLQQICDLLLKMVVISSVFWILLRLVDFFYLIIKARTHIVSNPSQNQFLLFFKDFLKVFLVILGLLSILHFLLGQDIVDKLIGALGIGAAALALAAKESIENLIGSFIILFDQPFLIGDYVKVNHYSGVVEKIGLRSTRIRTDQKSFLTVPNKQMVDSILDNISQMNGRSTNISLELSSETSAEKVKGVVQDLKDILKGEEEVLDGFTVNFNDIVKDGLLIQVIFYTLVVDWKAYTLQRERVMLKILRSLQQREVHLNHKMVIVGPLESSQQPGQDPKKLEHDQG